MEENPVEGSKSKLIIVSVIVIILVIASIGIYLIGGGASGITAREAIIIADEAALDWNDNATLLNCRKAGPGRSGVFDGWFCKYVDTVEIIDSTECIEIMIYKNGSSIVRENASYGPYLPLGNWNLDSDEVYDIAIKRNEIKDFLNHYPMIDSFYLGNYTGTPIWVIEWAYNAFIDDPHWAKIEIDANTGEVLYVDADN